MSKHFNGIRKVNAMLLYILLVFILIPFELHISTVYTLSIYVKVSFEKSTTWGTVAAEKEPFSTQLDRRVRYWVDGLVIGSELFVRNTVAAGRVRYKVKKRRLTRAVERTGRKEPLYSFKQLRFLLE
jgi:hypothetical protein